MLRNFQQFGQRTDPTSQTMNAEQAKLVFMKIQIIQTRLPAFRLLLINTYAETELAATDLARKFKYARYFFYAFASFTNPGIL